MDNNISARNRTLRYFAALKDKNIYDVKSVLINDIIYFRYLLILSQIYMYRIDR